MHRICVQTRGTLCRCTVLKFSLLVLPCPLISIYLIPFSSDYFSIIMFIYALLMLNEQLIVLFGQIQTSQRGGKQNCNTSPYGDLSLESVGNVLDGKWNLVKKIEIVATHASQCYLSPTPKTMLLSVIIYLLLLPAFPITLKSYKKRRFEPGLSRKNVFAS